MTLENKDIVSGGLMGGFMGSEFGNWKISVEDLNQEQKNELNRLVEDLTAGRATYVDEFSGDFGCVVAVNDVTVFQSKSFSLIPNQYQQLKYLANLIDEASRPTTSKNEPGSSSPSNG